jgi:hypothetical protein
LGVTAKRAKAAEAHWALWETFCLEHNIDPFVRNYGDAIPIIQVFAQRYRDGRGAPKHNVVHSGTVEEAVCAVGQAFIQLGATDIRKDAFGEIDFRLTRQFWCYKKEDPPPSRVKPVPILIIIFILNQACSSTSIPYRQAVAEMITITFYFLLRPGEYSGTTSDYTPFHLQEVELHVGDRLLDTMSSSSADLDAATMVSITFTTQKNGKKGEVITHGLSTDPLVCPIKDVVRRIHHLHLHKSKQSTPLASYFHSGKCVAV